MLNVNIPEVRDTLFSLIAHLGKDADGDFIDIENERYYVNVLSDFVSVCVKCRRVKKKDNTPYVTGDTQDWTYEYTWEDLEETFNDSSSDKDSYRNNIFMCVRTFFKDNPEKALEGGRFKEWTADEVRRLCEESLL